MRAKRILIIGGEASGKTTLARQLAEVLGAPLHELDHVAWQSAASPERDLRAAFHPDYQVSEAVVQRPRSERLSQVQAIADQGHWVAEGVFLWWTDPLFAAADRIIWLDHVRFPTVILRVIARHARSARRTAEGRDIGDMVRKLPSHFGALRGLVTVMMRVGRFHFAPGPSTPAPDDYGAITRRAMRSVVGAHASKLVHIRSERDLRELVQNPDWAVNLQ